MNRRFEENVARLLKCMTSHLAVDDMLGLVGWVHLVDARCHAVVVNHRMDY